MDAGFLTSARGCFPGTTFPAILAEVDWISNMTFGKLWALEPSFPLPKRPIWEGGNRQLKPL